MVQFIGYIIMNGERIERVIELNDDLLERNNEIAEKNSEMLKKHGIRGFDMVGAIGAGKTLILEKIMKILNEKYKILVINGDVTTRVDADRIERQGENIHTVQVNTGRECSLTSYHIMKVLQKFNFEKYNLVFIENVGNLICPSDFILGTDFFRIVVVSVTEGEHVVRKHPLLFKMSQVAVINKLDLLPHLDDVDIDRMVEDALAINPSIKVIKISAKTDEGINELIQALNL
jgi:hydrogenase nickel incorporation protein HypB